MNLIDEERIEFEILNPKASREDCEKYFVMNKQNIL
jgi:hypothetical protein